jgi:hypothetical protein
MSESDQCLHDTAFRRFWELRRNLKSLHRLKYAQYIMRIEGGLKNNPREFLKYADLKRNAGGYSSSIFLGNDYAQDSQSIANLFAGFFQSLYLRDDLILDSDLPTPDDGHKMSATEVSEDEFECAFLGLDVNSYFKTVSIGCQSFFDIRF